MWCIINLSFNFGVGELLLIFLALVNVLTFFLYGIDKRKAVKNKWRISERTLIFFTLACGGIGALLGMCFFRHKRSKLKFKFSLMVGLIIVSILLSIVLL
jgi:uncharacterized membrane protein YsdA (DUF1294 family)